MKEITDRIDHLRRRRGVEAKALYTALGLQKWDWSRKIRLDRSSFTIEEISRLCVLLDAPLGFPFVDLGTAERLERAERAAMRELEGEAPTEEDEGPPKE